MLIYRNYTNNAHIKCSVLLLISIYMAQTKNVFTLEKYVMLKCTTATIKTISEK